MCLPIPFDVHIAFSGGVDSMAIAHFLKMGGRKITLLHFDHGCEYSAKIKEDCVEFALRYDMSIVTMTGKHECPNGASLEDFWRRQRYKALRSYANSTDTKFITCHHLDDAVETWIWSSLHGSPKLIAHEDQNLYRPFLTTEKQELIDYALKHNLTVVDDPYNEDLTKMRNYMRRNLIPHAFHINPGIKKVIRKKYISLLQS